MITYAILIATVVVSIACFSNGSLFNKLSYSPYRMVHANEWYRIISHGFVHADWVHLFVNMFTFLSFGQYVEKAFSYMGFSGGSFILLYFGGMIAASLYDLWKYRDNRYYTSIGASGAVSAVLFTAIFLNPWDKIYLFAAIPIPGIVFGFVYLWYCQYMAKRGGDNINHNAHFYGAVYGFVFPILLEPGLLQVFIQQLLRH
ncbi:MULTISPECIES: rhomboid family intramembrane serine protease [Butyricimonas]|uniref:rhomboid family intramembrane serine protease n=1 Tax=Butyricimonas TaxID=574697 RepID=UPI0007FB3A45|nr:MULTISPECIES: rhomboid family intramembrane serine protease [Butyricimonas]